MIPGKDSPKGAAAAVSEGLEIPARKVPVPTTVSPEMQALIAAPRRPIFASRPTTVEEWKWIVKEAAVTAVGAVPGLSRRMNVKFEPTWLGEVPAFLVTPQDIAPENRNRLLIHVHGSCYVLGPGEAGLAEAVLMAGFGRFKVMSVDYRMPPEAYFPVALDDIVAAWKAALAIADPKRMAVFGTSAGGALTLALILRAKQEGLALPAAIAPGTPMSDVTKTGDTFHTNELLDNVLVSRDGMCDAAVRFYANGHDLADPLLSPVYGDLSGFPPAILTSGTRDLLLSNTVRVHRKLRQANVEADLHVYEGQSHAHYLFNDAAPETRDVFQEIVRFFDRHLAR